MTMLIEVQTQANGTNPALPATNPANLSELVMVVGGGTEPAPATKGKATGPAPKRRKYKRMVADLKAIANHAYSTEFVIECLSGGELGDAKLFSNIATDTLVYDHSEGAWFWWNGIFWEPDRATAVPNVASEILCMTYTRLAVEKFRQAIKLKGDVVAKGKDHKQTDDEKSAIEDAESTYSAAKKRAAALRGIRDVQRVLEYARAGVLLGLTGDEWDKAQGVLPCVNGTLNLATGDLTEPRPQDYMRTVSPTEYKGLNEPAPRFIKFLAQILPNQPEVITYLQTLLGYSLLGTAQLDLLVQLYGEDGRNGKDTLMELLFYVLGEGIASAVSNDVLITRKDKAAGSASPHLMSLRGKRLIWASEPKQGERLDAGQVKLLTGGGILRVRQLHKAEISFEQTHLLFLLTNYLPHAQADDGALWARMRVIKFLQRFIEKPDPTNPNEHMADDGLKEALRKEASGVLAWLVRGCLEFQKNGLHTPESVRMATDEYKTGEDTLGQFIAEWFELDATYGPNTKPTKEIKRPEFGKDNQPVIVKQASRSIGAKKVYDMYQEWCEQNNLPPMNNLAFGTRMKKKFYFEHTRDGKFYYGLAPDPQKVADLTAK